MQQKLVHFFETYAAQSIEDISSLTSLFEESSPAKHTYLLKAGEKAQSFFLIVSGYVRIWHLNQDGEEITTEVYGPGEIATSIYSIMHAAAAYENVQCLTDCSILAIKESDFTELYQQHPAWALVGMKVLKNIVLKKESRIARLLQMNAKERYQNILDEHPDYIQHVPVKHLSSFLGMKPESLSRIRKQFIFS